ncbi:hypothetical protein H4S03_005981 [Coemansia sp. S3946]|nr:hypothetical protein H4S03_005981 [Coemansia sp. S3946]
MAKELCIRIEERDIYTGAALRILSQDFNEDCAFPLVRTFTLLFESCEDEDLSDVDDSGESRESVDNYDVYQANVSAFVLWIKQMVPMASDIRVKLGSSFSPEISCEDHFSDLVSRLYQLGNRVKYSCESRKGVPVELGLDEIRDLVHISLKDKYSSGRFTHLARQNAQTLQSLYLESPRFYNLVNLIQNPGGSYVTTKLDIWQAISLVKSLPLLSDLTAPFPRIGAMPYGVTRAELPKYMTSTYSPMGERFRCWHLQYCTDEDQTGDVEWMLLLALICPNFDYVATGQERRESFMEDLEWYIDLERFSSYAPRLRRLLFNGWQNC